MSERKDLVPHSRRWKEVDAKISEAIVGHTVKTDGKGKSAFYYLVPKEDKPVHAPCGGDGRSASSWELDWSSPEVQRYCGEYRSGSQQGSRC